jgi:tetratricopeptide (TPR) repeat protein
MFPHLTPFGIIMKINRQPLAELSEDILRRDHEFWTQFSKRLIGDWITYDTTVKEIADFVERVYLRRNFRGFTGDRRFVRDDQAQKAFSKLRSSIGGVYNYRVNTTRPGSPEHERVVKEADFAFRQAFAFCPYSPEAVFRYVQLLLNRGRLDDAILIARTCLKLDPYNSQVVGLVNNLEGYRRQMQQVAPAGAPQAEAQQLQRLAQEAAAQLNALLQAGRTNEALTVADRLLAGPQQNAELVLAAAQVYAKAGNYPKLEKALEKLVQVAPGSPEAWYDLGVLKTSLGKSNEAVTALKQALELSAVLRKQNPNARDLHAQAVGDARLAPLLALPEFQKLVRTN